MSFSEFINNQLLKRDWKPADLARKTGLTPQAISRYINQLRSKPDPEALAAIAAALELPIETVYAAAGIPTTRISQRDATLRELDLLFDSASPEQRDEIIRYARYILSEYTPRPLTNPSLSET